MGPAAIKAMIDEAMASFSKRYSVDFPTPGAAANIETSERRMIILFDSNALKQAGKGSPPILARPTLRTSVRILVPLYYQRKIVAII